MQAGGGAGKTDKRFIHEPRQETVRPAGDGIGFVQKCFGAEILSDPDRRRAGESAHGENGIGPTGFENFPRRKQRLHKAADERKIIAILQSDRRQREDFHAASGFHGFLIHLLGRNQQGHGAAALLQLLSDGQSGKQMPARAAAGNGDEGHFGSGNGHVALAANGFSSMTAAAGRASRTGACRATLNNKPMQVSIASRLDPP